jgi:hypothetical protein
MADPPQKLQKLDPPDMRETYRALDDANERLRHYESLETAREAQLSTTLLDAWQEKLTLELSQAQADTRALIVAFAKSRKSQANELTQKETEADVDLTQQLLCANSRLQQFRKLHSQMKVLHSDRVREEEELKLTLSKTEVLLSESISREVTLKLELSKKDKSLDLAERQMKEYEDDLSKLPDWGTYPNDSRAKHLSKGALQYAIEGVEATANPHPDDPIFEMRAKEIAHQYLQSAFEFIKDESYE